MYQRYVNNKILMGSYRPQPDQMCSITAMTSAFNSLLTKQYTPLELLALLPWDQQFIMGGNIGNERFVEGLKIIASKLKLPIEAAPFLETVPLGAENIEREWRKIQAALKSPDTILIYHQENHFTVLAGYYEEPLRTEDHGKYEFETRRDWLVVAEHSTWGDWQPIRLIQWLEVRDDIRSNDNHMIIKLSLT